MTLPRDTGSFATLFESAPKQGAPRRCKVGDVLDLEVVRVGEAEVLVALDGKQEGFIEASELRGPDGRPTVAVGSRIAARVVDIDRSSGSVRLTPVSAAPIVEALADRAPAAGAPDPSRSSSIVAGMRVRGKVTGVERYGVFVEFQVTGDTKRHRGLVPTAELGVPRGADLRKAFPAGAELEAAVVTLDERGRIRLSVVALDAAEERRAFQDYAATAHQGPSPRGDRGGAPGFGTLGDLLRKR